jgi:hypothetical protein
MGLFDHLRGSPEQRSRKNLERWKGSGEPKRWVQKHNLAWNHDDWLSLLDSLEKSEYWPMNPDEVGAVLEEVKRGAMVSLGRLSSPLFHSSPRSSDDGSLVSEAYSLMSNRRWGEAADLIQRGLESCNRKDRLCELMGNIRLNERNPVGIGWCMQACVLASPSWVPYLLVSYAAQALGLEKLAWRSLNACDVVDTGMKRIDRLEADIRVLAGGAARSELLAAMKNFETVMDPYLPSPDALPHDQHSRSVAVLQNITGDPNQPPDSLRAKLLRRA